MDELEEVKKEHICDTFENRVAPVKQELFLKALLKRKLNVIAATKQCGIDKSSLYKQRQISEDFALAWANVEDELLDDLEEDQYKSAKEKGEDRRYILGRRRGRRWSEKQAIAIKGVVDHRHASELSDEELGRIVDGHN